MTLEEQPERWPGDQVQYVVGVDMHLAEIIELDGVTQARVKVLSGPLSGQEVVAPWGIVRSIGPTWRRFDPNDTNTHPENLSRIEMQLSNRQVFTGRYSRDLGWFTSIGSVMPADHDLMQKRWRYANEGEEQA
jgi:hypothetical protein